VTDSQKVAHLADLFLRAGNKIGERARWINYYRGWCPKFVSEGYYEALKESLTSALTRAK